MASCPHPSQGGHVILAGPVCHSLSREFDSGEEQIQSGNDWNPLWCPETFFFVFSLWILRDDSVLALPEAGSSAIPCFFELPHILPGTPFFFCLSWLDTVSVECNQSSMTNTAPQDICQGRQIAGFQWTHDRLPVLSPNVFIPPASNHPTLEIGWGMTLL